MYHLLTNQMLALLTSHIFLIKNKLLINLHLMLVYQVGVDKEEPWRCLIRLLYFTCAVYLSVKPKCTQGWGRPPAS